MCNRIEFEIDTFIAYKLSPLAAVLPDETSDLRMRYHGFIKIPDFT